MNTEAGSEHREQGTVFIVEDETESLNALSRALSKSGYDVQAFGDSRVALEAIRQGGNPDLVVTDIRMPEVDGLEILKAAKEQKGAPAVLLITAHGSVRSAVDAMKVGADDYLTKPIDLFELRKRVQQLMERQTLSREVEYLKSRLDKKYGIKNIIGSSAIMERLVDQIMLVAPTNSTVLITGESGTGKELVANAIHQKSPRASEKFLPINCSAITPSLLESELFGHERGSFTGAVQQRIGKLEMTNHGTLFLDEIGEVSHEIQVKLLRFLETKEIMRVGASKIVSLDVRIVAATNRDLNRAVREGDFREDLYHRLKVIALETPPLREHREDVPLLVEHFLQELCNEHNKTHLSVSPEAMGALMSANWTGNVRELRNVLERLVVLSQKDSIDLSDIPTEQRSQPGAVPEEKRSLAGLPMSEIEKMAILETLETTRGNRKKASEILGISLRTLQTKLKLYKARGEFS